jgi:UDP-2,3-diacylglucosamine hydrolase
LPFENLLQLDGPDGTAKSGAITFLEGARPQIQMF